MHEYSKPFIMELRIAGAFGLQKLINIVEKIYIHL